MSLGIVLSDVMPDPTYEEINNDERQHQGKISVLLSPSLHSVTPFVLMCLAYPVPSGELACVA